MGRARLPASSERGGMTPGPSTLFTSLPKTVPLAATRNSEESPLLPQSPDGVLDIVPAAQRSRAKGPIASARHRQRMGS
jgi:hypothetical protein